MALTQIKSSGISNAAITANQLTANAVVGIIQAGDYIRFNPNGRINATISAGNNISIEANGRISSTASGGGGGSGVILLSNTTITANFDIPVGQNGLSIGPVTIVDGANVTVAPGQRWLIL